MTIYELINPSDPYTLEADDRLLACLVACMIGDGWFPLEAADGSPGMPILALGADPDEWFRATFGKPLGGLLDEITPDRLLPVLDSVLLCTRHERRAYADALAAIEDPARREELRLKWHEERRSSTHDIGRKARAYADAIRNHTSRKAAP